MIGQKNGAILSAAKSDARLLARWGKHVTTEKALVLFVVTMLACATPMLCGIRLWDSIPKLVATGIIRFDGTDDSMPRPALVFGIPGLLCVLTLIFHVQLFRNQKRLTLPNAFVRLMGRWGAPVLSVLLSNSAVFGAVGRQWPTASLFANLLGLGLLLLGAQMLDCPQGATIALRFSFLETEPAIWSATHRLASYLWMMTGLWVLTSAAKTEALSPIAPVVIAAALLLPILYGVILSIKKRAS